jgi:hypothetical protein
MGSGRWFGSRLVVDPGAHVIESGQEFSQKRGGVSLVISHHQIDGRPLAGQRTAGDRPWQIALYGCRQQSHAAAGGNERHGHCKIIHLKRRNDLYTRPLQIVFDGGAQYGRHIRYPDKCITWQIVRINSLICGERVIARQDHNERLLPHELILEIRL